jgi:lipopolysaccharide export LptBFGC system permease protein LptF
MLMIMATLLSLFLLMSKFVLPWCEEMSSDVISRIMAMTASQRLKSHKDSGNPIALVLYDLVAGF